MSARAARRRGIGRRRWENRDGWWGILRVCLLATTAVVLLGGAGALALAGPAAGASAALGGALVLLLSALTGWTTAAAWDRAREAALPLSVGAFVVKAVGYALLLAVVPTPGWLLTVPAAIGALGAVVVWQAAEVLAFARTRRGIYAD